MNTSTKKRADIVQELEDFAVKHGNESLSFMALLLRKAKTPAEIETAAGYCGVYMMDEVLSVARRQLTQAERYPGPMFDVVGKLLQQLAKLQ